MRRLLALLLACGARTGLEVPSIAPGPDAAVTPDAMPSGDAGSSSEGGLCSIEVSDAGETVTAAPSQIVLGAEHVCVRAGGDVWNGLSAAPQHPNSTRLTSSHQIISY